MKVKVLLLADVKGLGKAKSIVSVSRGYALNFLVPKGLARILSEESESYLHSETRSVEEARIAHANKEKELLEAKVLVFKAKAGEGERLFGSITASDIAEKLKGITGIDVDKKKIELESHIKKLGDYVVKVKLYKEVEADVKVKVEKE